MIPVNYAFAFFGLLFASIFDIKTREIPDWLNYSLIALGFGTAIISIFILQDIFFLLSAILGFVIAFFIALLFYKAGQWGGGDAKMLMALGALIGFDFRFGMPIFLILLLNIFVVGALYGFVWSAILALKHKDLFKKHFKLLLSSGDIKAVRIGVLMFSIFGLFLFVIAPVKVKPIILGVITIVFFIFYFFVYSKAVEKSSMEKRLPVSKLTEGDWIVEPVFVKRIKNESAYAFFLGKFKKKKSFADFFIKEKKTVTKRNKKRWNIYYNSLVKQILFYHKTRSKGLLHGLFESVKAFLNKGYSKDLRQKVHDVLIMEVFPDAKHPLLESIKNFLETRGFYQSKELICGPDNKEGLSLSQITKLKKEHVKFVTVKEGIPFLPSFFIAFIITLLIGNWILFFF